MVNKDKSSIILLSISCLAIATSIIGITQFAFNKTNEVKVLKYNNRMITQKMDSMNNIYANVRPEYHSINIETIDYLLNDSIDRYDDLVLCNLRELQFKLKLNNKIKDSLMTIIESNKQDAVLLNRSFAKLKFELASMVYMIDSLKLQNQNIYQYEPFLDTTTTDIINKFQIIQEE